jgi:hypothetical protein
MGKWITNLITGEERKPMLWDREILEKEYPEICAEIRADEREKVINAIKWSLDDFVKRGEKHEII